MKVKSNMQSLSRSLIGLILLGIIYFLLHFFVLHKAKIVFQQPIIFDNANHVEDLLKAFFLGKDSDEVFQAINVEMAINETEMTKDKDELFIVYFWKKFCPCNIPVLSHYNELFQSYSYHYMMDSKKTDNSIRQNSVFDIRFYIADLSSALTIDEGDEISHANSLVQSPPGKVLPKDVVSLLAPYVEYSPSIAVLSKRRGLIYFGPHQLGFLCNAETSVLSKVISSYQQGIYSKNINVIGEGCFCKSI